MKISFNPQLLLEHRLNKDSYVFKISTRKPCVADEIIIYILSKILGVGICVFFRNTLWTTTQNVKVDAYTRDGYFIPIKHYDPADEEALLAKYCPEKVPNPVSKGKGKGTRKGGKGTKSVEPCPTPTTPPGTPKQKNTTTWLKSKR